MERMGPHLEPRARIAEAVLFLAIGLPLGLFDLRLDPPDFTMNATVAAYSSANQIGQIQWEALAAFAGLAIASAPNRFARAIIFAWPIVLLFAVCLLSVLWSDYPDIALRRALGLIVSAFGLFVGVTYIRPLERVPLICYLVFWCMLLVTLAVLPFPAAFDEHGLFRGATSHKNVLGAMGGLAIVFGLNVGRWMRHPITRALRVVYLVAWASVLVLTVSKTSIGLAVLVPVAYFALKASSGIVRLNGAVTLLSILALFLIGLELIYCAAGYTPLALLQLVVPDASFTGRTPIWTFTWTHISDNWLAGHGFGSFWGIGYDAANLHSLYDYIRLINQSHNGYLDVLVTLGVIGIVCVLIVLLHFGNAAEALYHRDRALFRLVWMLMLYALLHNAMESSIVTPYHPVWQITLLALFISTRAAAELAGERPCLR